ncbi:uncharacterized protein PV09_05938 [Verruconis gallopava]|uniref:Rhodopsin domain-containing protein n=1 Tax=Verruconis gallopava TaxID=253628 RepID=A0A0D2A805_9PEZI|nr:uncharacterized protein PV09_05938 [Verruconis gallopava]KIW02888.1 hypothetical protein PV09_05938 [Verruconis gallopava]
MRSPPLSVIATWPPANYVDPVTRGPALLIIECIFISLAWIVLVLRMYVRLVMLRRTWWDDWIMIIAAICTTGVTACVILATQRYGWDLHVWDVKYEQLIAGRKISIAAQTIFLWASNLTKLSILLSYLRIATPKSKFRFFTWCSIVYVILIHVIFHIVLWTQCSPASKYWDLFDNNRHCEDEGPPLMGQISTSIAADFIVYVLPMATMARLRLPLSQRIILMVVFGFGAVVVVAGCLRLYYTHLTVYETYDVTWVGYNLWIWTAVEVNLGIICGCVPALRPLVYKAKTHLTSNYLKTGSTSSKRSRSYGIGSIRKSQPADNNLDGDVSLVDKNISSIEKTVDWEVTETDQSLNEQPAKPFDHTTQGSWLEDSDGHSDPSRRNQLGVYGMSATEITRSSFGLKR